MNVPVLLETGVLVLLLHYKCSCIVGDRGFSVGDCCCTVNFHRSFSAAAAQEF